MIPASAMLACPNLATPAALMYHVAQVESNFNPFAIGVVGGRLARQPDSLGEAVATAQMLEAKGYNFSLGLAQVNRNNLQKYGLDTYAKAFSICDNLRAGSRILAQCYASTRGDWGKAFSCYYAGDYTTGFRDGYVQKILATFSQGFRVASNDSSAMRAIPVIPTTPSKSASPQGGPTPVSSAAYRIAIRSSALDAIAGALVTPVANAIAQHVDNPSGRPSVSSNAAPPQPAPAADSSARDHNIFVPRVTGPGGPSVHAPRTGAIATTKQPAEVLSDGSSTTADNAFVF